MLDWVNVRYYDGGKLSNAPASIQAPCRCFSFTAQNTQGQACCGCNPWRQTLLSFVTPESLCFAARILGLKRRCAGTGWAGGCMREPSNVCRRDAAP